MNEMADVIIIGAGASGLMAGNLLAKAGKKVTILEGKPRAGGRIHTFRPASGPAFFEAGAEFIHGDLPHTFKVLKKAGIDYEKVKGTTWQFKNGALKEDEEFIPNWKGLMKKLKGLEYDMTVDDFLQQYFSGEDDATMRASVKGFVQGYDAADIKRASAFAFRDESLDENDATQYRIKGGYIQLVAFLEQQCRKQSADIRFSTVVKKVTWSEHQVTVMSEDDQIFHARQLLITVPLGVLQAEAHQKGAISLSPPLPEKYQAFQSMGFGAVVKILLEFHAPFWLEKGSVKNKDKGLKDLSFIFSDASIPTWWTQFPDKSSLLTGWLGGPDAAALADKPDEFISDMALEALTTLFNFSKAALREKLQEVHIFNWMKDPLARGAYTYATTGHEAALEAISRPVSDTIYFAGEACYKGAEIGTVEAALASGYETAEKMLGERLS
jgi:monoamine oxidase